MSKQRAKLVAIFAGFIIVILIGFRVSSIVLATEMVMKNENPYQANSRDNVCEKLQEVSTKNTNKPCNK